MQKLKKTIISILSFSFTGFLLYTGVYLGMTGFMNILSFWIWFAFITGFLVIFNDDAIVTCYKSYKSRYSNIFLERTFHMGAIVTLAYFGHFVLATIYTLEVIFDINIKEKGKKLLESGT